MELFLKKLLYDYEVRICSKFHKLDPHMFYKNIQFFCYDGHNIYPSLKAQGLRSNLCLYRMYHHLEIFTLEGF